ncbi:MAG: ABC transporter permease subunit [Oscillospiraceae bacterium]|nr:ABC transporter permease subunit [Oscillospiraceae bacterium]
MNRSSLFVLIKKELTRLFGDRRLVFSGILLQGLLLYVMYSVMGNFMGDMISVDEDYTYKVYAVNAPQSFSMLISESGMPIELTESDAATARQNVADNKADLFIMFSSDFDSQVAGYDIASGSQAPQIQIWHNASRIESLEADSMVKNLFREFERSMVKKFDINADLDPQEYDLNTGMDFASSFTMSLIPMLIIMVMYQGCMAIAPESIAGEKERGTLGTILVTPAKRSNIALAKILSISVFGILGAVVTFGSMMLSLPKMFVSEADGFTFDYSVSEYLCILLLTISTVLVFVALLSVLSAYAKSTKEATTHASPLIIVGMVCGMSSMITGGAVSEFYYYFIPIFNSAHSLTGIFTGDASTLNIAITALTNTAVALIFTAVLTKMFSSERIVFDK